MSRQPAPDALAVAVAAIRGHLVQADPAAIDGTRAAELVEVFAEIERLGAAGTAIYAKRVADAGAWQRSGERSAADWLAKKTGVSVGAARGALDTAANASKSPVVEEALRHGDLSAPQAEAIAGAAAVDPSAASRLLDDARTKPLPVLRDECARVRAAATDMESRHHEIHRRRSFRAWSRADGTRCGMYEMTPDAAAVVEREIKRRAEEAFAAARASGEREPSEAYAADGLVAMAHAAREAGRPSVAASTDGDPSPAPAPCRAPARRRPEAIVIVNLESLHRGWVDGDELCEIPGAGQVPVSVARDLLGDALLRIVIRDGHDVLTEVHAGRLASDAQRAAIQVRQRGRWLRPGCHHPIDEIDHTEGYPITGATALDDLGGLCRTDHRNKTLRGHRYRRGARGWEWHRPDGTVEYERPPP